MPIPTEILKPSLTTLPTNTVITGDGEEVRSSLRQPVLLAVGVTGLVILGYLVLKRLRKSAGKQESNLMKFLAEASGVNRVTTR